MYLLIKELKYCKPGLIDWLTAYCFLNRLDGYYHKFLTFIKNLATKNNFELAESHFGAAIKKKRKYTKQIENPTFLLQ